MATSWLWLGTLCGSPVMLGSIRYDIFYVELCTWVGSGRCRELGGRSSWIHATHLVVMKATATAKAEGEAEWALESLQYLDVAEYNR
jgi:hypothetical protein